MATEEEIKNERFHLNKTALVRILIHKKIPADLEVIQETVDFLEKNDSSSEVDPLNNFSATVNTEIACAGQMISIAAANKYRTTFTVENVTTYLKAEFPNKKSYN